MRVCSQIQHGKTMMIVMVLFLALTVGLSAQSWDSLPGPYTGYIKYLAVDQNDNVYAGSSEHGIYKLNNGDTWWNQISTAPSGRGLFVNDDNTVYAGSSMAVMRSNDAGQSFETVYEITETKYGIFDMYVYGTAGSDLVFIGASDRIRYTTDNCQTWEYAQNDTIPYLKVYIAKDSSVYCGTGELGLFRSRDLCSTYTAINNGITNLHINDILVSPCGMIYAATAGGIFRSIDDGASFQTMNTGLTNLDIRAIEFTNEGVMYAGAYYGGMFRSYDYGEHWTTINDGIGSQNILDIATKSTGEVFVGTSCGIFYSGNNGSSWQKMNYGLLDRDLSEIIITDQGDLICGGNGGYIYQSHDYGQTWIQHDLKSDYNYNLKCTSYGSNIYAAGYGGVYRSFDNGNNWEDISGNLDERFFSNIITDSEGNIYLGGNSNFISYDQGDSWQEITAFFANIRGLEKNRLDEIFVIGYDGLRKTTDQGATWVLVHDTTQIGRPEKLHIDNYDNIYITNSENGLYRSSDNGHTWTNIKNNLPDYYVRSIANDSNGYLYTSFYSDGIFRSTDLGNTWENFNLNLPTMENDYYIWSFEGNVFSFYTVDYQTVVYRLNNDGCVDSDGDWVCDNIDNCVNKYNPDQADANSDGIGDLCCCSGMRGDVNGDGLEQMDIEDLVYLIDFQFRQGPEPPCFYEADISPINTPDGLLDVGDIVAMVNYQFRGGAEPAGCP